MAASSIFVAVGFIVLALLVFNAKREEIPETVGEREENPLVTVEGDWERDILWQNVAISAALLALWALGDAILLLLEKVKT